MITDAEKESLKTLYTDSQLHFGKVLDTYLKNSAPKFGVFQNALVSAIPDFVDKLISKKRLKGFGLNGAVTTPTGVIPVVVPPSSVLSCSFTNFHAKAVTYDEAVVACKDEGGAWAGILKLIANYIARGSGILSCSSCFGLYYYTYLKTVFSGLPLLWYERGVAFQKEMIAKQVDDHDYCFYMVSNVIDQLIKTTMIAVQPISYPVTGGVFNGVLNWSFSDYDTPSISDLFS